MSGNIYYGHCCNRIIVSRRWKYCPNCGGPLKRNADSGEMERTMQGTYADLVMRSEARALGTEDMMAQIEALETETAKDAVHLNSLRDEITELWTQNEELTALVDLAAREPQKEVPRAPDVVLLSDSMPGISGSLGSVQEACGNLCQRGVNKDKPCHRFRENPDRTHAKGRHRY